MSMTLTQEFFSNGPFLGFRHQALRQSYVTFFSTEASKISWSVRIWQVLSRLVLHFRVGRVEQLTECYFKGKDKTALPESIRLA
jgi:hypothetical protein